MERPSYRYWLAVAAVSAIPLLQTLHSQALAQQQQPLPPPPAPPPAVLGISPNTGGSTLDQLRPPRSDSIELQFPSGYTCRAGGGDVPSLVAYTDSGQLQAPLTGISGLRAGMALVVPLYRPRRNLCDRAVQLQDALSLLEVAEKLVTAGAMSNTEYLRLTERVKRDVLGVQTEK